MELPSKEVIVNALKRRGFDRMALITYERLLASGLSQEVVVNGKIAIIMQVLRLDRYQAWHLREALRILDRDWMLLNEDDDPPEEQLRTVVFVNLMGEQEAGERIAGELRDKDPQLVAEFYSENSTYVSTEKLGYLRHADVVVFLLTGQNLFELRHGRNHKPIYEFMEKLATKGLAPKVVCVRLKTMRINEEDPIFGQALCLPTGDEAVSGWSDKDAAYLNVADGIRRLLAS